MSETMFQWLIHTDAGLFTRIGAGLVIFAALGITDLVRNGDRATRWREYAVLLVAVAAALFYGVVNDQLTVSISWEYFFYGKEIDRVLGPEVPPNMSDLRWEAAKVGMKATWSAGLLFGAALLLANNPMRRWPRLRNRDLLRFLPIIVITAAIAGAIGGMLGYYGFLNHVSTDFEQMIQGDVLRPRQFICTWGIHLGGYVGGMVGTIAAVIGVVRRRRTFSPEANQ